MRKDVVNVKVFDLKDDIRGEEVLKTRCMAQELVKSACTLDIWNAIATTVPRSSFKFEECQSLMVVRQQERVSRLQRPA